MKYRIIKKPVNPTLVHSREAYFPQYRGWFFIWHSFVEVNDGELKEVSFNRFEDAEDYIEREIPRKYNLDKKIVIYEV